MTSPTSPHFTGHFTTSIPSVNKALSAFGEVGEMGSDIYAEELQTEEYLDNLAQNLRCEFDFTHFTIQGHLRLG